MPWGVSLCGWPLHDWLRGKLFPGAARLAPVPVPITYPCVLGLSMCCSFRSKHTPFPPSHCGCIWSVWPLPSSVSQRWCL